MQSILNNPKYGPRSELGTNMFTYLKFGLPRVLPPGKGDQVGREALRMGSKEKFFCLEIDFEQIPWPTSNKNLCLILAWVQYLKR